MIDRTIRPPPTGALRFTSPAIQQARLRNGLALWLTERHELPTVVFNVALQTGAGNDPVDRPGISTMTAECLDSGTSTMDVLGIASRLEFIGATMTANAGLDGTSISMAVLRRHVSDASLIFAEIIRDAVFPEQEFVRLRKQRLTALVQQRDRAAAVASLAFQRIVYGSHHPYGLDSMGTEQSLNALGRNELQQFWSVHYRPNNGTLIVVGDTTIREIVGPLEAAFGGWTSSLPPLLAIPPPPAPAERKVFLIDKPGAPQSEIRIGMAALARNTPDFYPVLVMNRVLGGQFSSRLNSNLREKRGLTYGARSAFFFNKQPGPFVASAAVGTQSTDVAVREFLVEMEKMRSEGITKEELAFSKTGITGGFALNFETPGQIAAALQSIALYALPMDYYSDYLPRIEKVSLEDVSRVAARHLDTSRMAVVVVGDVKTIRGPIEKLGLGPTLLCDAEGSPGDPHASACQIGVRDSANSNNHRSTEP